ncbi:hypothetical protein Tcan_00859, partial [Toxocara canis]
MHNNEKSRLQFDFNFIFHSKAQSLPLIGDFGIRPLQKFKCRFTENTSSRFDSNAAEHTTEQCLAWISPFNACYKTSVVLVAFIPLAFWSFWPLYDVLYKLFVFFC